jgi:hypothetical protein
VTIKIKADEMKRAHTTLGKDEKCIKTFSRETYRGKSHSEDTCVDGRAILISTSRKWYERV